MGKSNWRSFEEARSFVHQLQLKSQNEWREWTKNIAKPHDIPANPARTYKEDWRGFGDWLGTGTIAVFNRIYCSFEEAQIFVHQFDLKSKNEWINWAKTTAKPAYIPADPAGVYKDKGWNGWGDWLGTGTIAPFNREYRPFKEARTYVHQLQLKNQKEWRNWAKSEIKPDDIPANPSLVYKDAGWSSFGDWLGTGTIAVFNRIYLPFEEARIYVHQLQLKNYKEWNIWAKSGEKPENIPPNPTRTYENEGWKGFGDWLGTGYVANQNRSYRQFEEVRAFVHQLELKSKGEWTDWAKSKAKPEYIPANPVNAYKDKGWNGWGDWLGTGAIAPFNREYRPFEEARTYVHQLQLKNQKEWRDWAKSEIKPDDIPANPSLVYKD